MRIDDRRLGRFFISSALLERTDTLQQVAKLTASFVIFEAQYRVDRDAMEYLAWSPLFPPTPPYATVPYYELIMHQDGSVTLGYEAATGAKLPDVDYMAAVRDSAKAQ